MTPLLALLVYGLYPGSWRTDHFDSVRHRLVESFGHKVVTIDIDPRGDKLELLDHVAAELEFPTWFGRNWDALSDSLSDLSPLGAEAPEPGDRRPVVVLRAVDATSDRSPTTTDPGSAAATMIEIFDQVAEETGLCVIIAGFDVAAEPTDD